MIGGFSMKRRQFLAFGAGVSAYLLGVQGAWAQAATNSVRLRVGFIPIMGVAPLFVADREGWLRQRGVELAFTQFESGPNMIQALASGTIDVYLAGVAPLAVARERGIKVKVVAATAIAENVLGVGPRLAAEFRPGVAPAAAFRAFRAASGKAARLATQPAGSVPNTVLQYWLFEVAKVDRADVEIVPMGIDATQQAILADAVDGASLREPALSIIQDRKPGVRVVALGEEMFPGQPGTVLALTEDIINRNPAAVQVLVASLIRAVELITRTPDRALPHIEAALGKGIVAPALIRRALASPATKFQIDPRTIIEPTRALQAYQVRLGSLEREAPLDGLFEPRFFQAAAQR